MIAFRVLEFGGEPSIPLPRPLAEMDRVITLPGGDTAAASLERGLAANAEGRPDLALESFDAAITREPNYALAHFQRANTIGPGDLREAGRGYLRCVELGFAVGPALLQYATVLRQCGSREQAADTLRDLTARLPEYGPGWYRRALTAVKDGRYDESIEAATHAVRLMPEHGEAFYTRACAHALRGEAESALADIHRAIEVDSSLRPQREPEELIAAWTLLDGDWDLVRNKTGATRLGFSLFLKFFEQEGRFPRHVGELPKAAVDYMSGQVKVMGRCWPSTTGRAGRSSGTGRRCGRLWNSGSRSGQMKTCWPSGWPTRSARLTNVP